MNGYVNKLPRRLIKSTTFANEDFEQVIAYLKQEAELNARTADGCTLREQLLSVERQTKKPVKELQDLVELPESMNQIWGHFIALDSASGSNGYSALPLSYSEILSYFTLLKEPVEVWEVQLIRRLDQTLLYVYAKQAEAELKSKKL